MSYPIKNIECIGKTYGARLREVGITTTGQLLAKSYTPIGRKELAVKSGISEHDLRKWADMADLMRIRGIATQYCELLASTGVESIEELRLCAAEQLHPALVEVNAKRKLVRQMPSVGQVAVWIAQARAMTPKMEY